MKKEIKERIIKWEELKNYLLAVQVEFEIRNGLDYCKNCGVDFRGLIKEFENILSQEKEKLLERIKLEVKEIEKDGLTVGLEFQSSQIIHRLLANLEKLKESLKKELKVGGKP